MDICSDYFLRAFCVLSILSLMTVSKLMYLTSLRPSEGVYNSFLLVGSSLLGVSKK